MGRFSTISPRFLAALSACLVVALCAPARAETGKTNIINGVTSNYAGTYMVGTNGPFNALIVTNAGVFNVTDDGIVGNSALANSNTAWVTGANSVWSNGGDLMIGMTGTFNRLLINNGGRTINGFGYVGYEADAADNAVVVTGAGSLWSNRNNLVVGRFGSGSELTITDDGAVSALNLYVGNQVGSSNNLVAVAGGHLNVLGGPVNGILNVRRGTLRLDDGTITVDQLFVTNNTSASTNAFFQFNAGTLTTRGGSEVVAPEGSDFSIGTTAGQMATWNILGGTNLLTVSDGRATRLGAVANAAGIVTVTGSGTLWSNSSDLAVGCFGSGSRLTISNGGTVVNADGYIGRHASGDGNSVLVTGSGSTWSNTAQLDIGYEGSFNQLTISNGGRVFSSGCDVCWESGSDNSILVTGNGSVWNSGMLRFGMQGGGNNQLIISNGGQVISSGGAIFGSDANNNSALVTGNGSVWNCGGLFLGYRHSHGNQLTISDGGRVINGFCVIGSDGNNNNVLVTGSGSMFSNSSYVHVGSILSGGNQLVISNGGQVINTVGYVGYSASTINNSVLVNGTDSVWRNSANLYVGYSGSGGQLTISKAGMVANGFGHVGYSSSASNNVVLVSGTNSLWNNSGPLVVGNFGSSNRVVVQAGGTVLASRLIVSADAGAVGNAVVVNGGLLQANNGPSWIGSNGVGTLAISNGVARFEDVNVGQFGIVRVAGGQLALDGTMSIGAGSGSDGTGQFVSGSVLIGPAGVLRLGTDFGNLTVTITNQGLLQTLAGSVSFNAGLDNQGTYSLTAAQLVTVPGGLANSGTLAVNPGSSLTADRLAQQTGSIYLNGGGALQVTAAWTNAGLVELSQGGVIRAGGTIHNDDLIEGSGTVQPALDNRAGGIVRAANGALSLNGATVANDAGGFFEAPAGGTLRIGRSMNNEGTINPQGGTIDLQANTLTNRGILTGYGTYRAAGIVNEGRAIFQGGNLNVQGAYVNAVGFTTEVAHASASFFGAVTNLSGGVFKNTDSHLIFFSSFVNNGTYISDPATNTFSSDLILGPDAALVGGAGDTFEFGAGFLNSSTNATVFNLSSATVSFTDGSHTMLLAGEDLGATWSGYTDNFAIGTLELADAALLKLEDGYLDNLSAALYVDYFNAETNQITSAYNIYYNSANNPLLRDQTYALIGGGWLIPIPEPATWVLLLLAGASALLSERRRVKP
ncbi:MAG: hypothetical protein FJ388_02690 [Verrucomicrobia bacterium]|nr:hypothetical protein [Verrucomicrobiota bacterium]